MKVGLKKKPIMRVTDLTYENIRHISASKLIEVLERNFGGGWDSLSQSIQDIIESGFDISTTTLPANRLHKDRKSTRLNSSHANISYAVFCLKKKKKIK